MFFSCYEILKPSGIERIPQLIKTCDPTVQLRRVQGPTTQAPKGGHLSCHQKSSKINPDLAVFLQVPGWAPKVKPFPQAYRLWPPDLPRCDGQSWRSLSWCVMIMFHITVMINIFISIFLIKILIVIILLILQTITHVSVLFVRICIDVARPIEGHASSTQAKTTALQGLAYLVPASEFASWIIWDVDGNGLRLSLLLLRSLSLLALYDDIYIYIIFLWTNWRCYVWADVWPLQGSFQPGPFRPAKGTQKGLLAGGQGPASPALSRIRSDQVGSTNGWCFGFRSSGFSLWCTIVTY